MASTVKRNRRALVPARNWQPQLLALDEASIGGADLSLKFSQPFFLKGVPQVERAGGTFPISAIMDSDDTVILTYATPIVSLTVFTLAAWDPSIRTSLGGYAAPFVAQPA